MTMIETKLSSVPPMKELGIEFITELNKLSIEERDEVTCDVHGINAVSEDPELFLISKCVESFESEITLIPTSEKEAYSIALEQNPKYVMDKNFLLMFLRADQFDTKAAAARFVAFFQVKLELFGRDKLGRDIRVDDLDEDDIACLESGYAQVLNARDRADRAIFMLMPMIKKFKTMENRVRASDFTTDEEQNSSLIVHCLFFLFHTKQRRAIYMALMFALKDVDTQKHGIVGIAYNVGGGKSRNRQAIMRNAQLVSALPLKFSAVHYCFDEENVRGIFYLAMYVFQKAARIRCRFHLGTDMEIIYTLMTFGIPNEALPVAFNGSFRLGAHRDYIRRMRKADEIDDDVDRIIVPGKYDVLLGRGKPLQKYSGNLNYHYIIEGYHDRYEQAAKGVKAELAKEIVTKIKNQGGRFLKQDEAGWAAISDETARSKVSHTFRNHRIAARTALKKALAKAQEISKQNDTAMPVPCRSNGSILSVRNNLNLRDSKKRKLAHQFDGCLKVL